MDHLLLTKNKLDISTVNDLVVDALCGAISLFVGTTRDNFDGKKVLTLEYEAYEPMALKEMKAICVELRTRWPDIVNIAIYHRIGAVPVAEASVIIAVSSPHRKSSLDAVSFAIEELKKRVPIWKKEQYENQDSEWKENKESSSKWKRRRNLNIFHCKIDEQDNVASNLVQIGVEQQEIQRRIQCFVEKKREEIDLNNILDYTIHNTYQVDDNQEGKESVEVESTCARINSTVVKQEGSKCHLRVQRVSNRIGPQVQPVYLDTLDKLMDGNVKTEQMDTEQATSKVLLQQRISCIEDYLSMPKHSTDIKQRLKNVENRLLYLESISPEYKHFLQHTNKYIEPRNSSNLANKTTTQPKSYTTDDLDKIIMEMQQSKQQSDVKIKKEVITE